MKQKLYKLIATSLLIASSTTVIAAGGQGEGSGQVKFHGYIINSPCSIVSDNPIQVEFGQISQKLLAQNSNTGESHIRPFEIELADCDVSDLANKTVTTTFSYTTADNLGTVGENYVGLESLPNSGVGIVIVAGNEQVKNSVPLKPQNIQNGPNTLLFSSYVKGLGQTDLNDPDAVTIKTGEFYATANFTLSYQ